MVKKNYKYFIGYLGKEYKVIPLHVMLRKASACVKTYGQTNCIYFLIEDDNLPEKYNSIWDKISNDIKKTFIATHLFIIKIILKLK